MERSTRKVLIGLVVSDKMTKTVTVSVETKENHPKYKKLVIQTKKYHVRDEKNEAKIGDKVEIVETKPLSKTVNFRISRIIERAK